MNNEQLQTITNRVFFYLFRHCVTLNHLSGVEYLTKKIYNSASCTC